LLTKVLIDGDGGAYTATLKQYQAKADYFACAYNQKNDGYNAPITPGGLLYLHEWNNMQYAASAAFLLAVYSDYLSAAKLVLKCPDATVQPQELIGFAKSQADYILGKNPELNELHGRVSVDDVVTLQNPRFSTWYDLDIKGLLGYSGWQLRLEFSVTEEEPTQGVYDRFRRFESVESIYGVKVAAVHSFAFSGTYQLWLYSYLSDQHRIVPSVSQTSGVIYWSGRNGLKVANGYALLRGLTGLKEGRTKDELQQSSKTARFDKKKDHAAGSKMGDEVEKESSELGKVENQLYVYQELKLVRNLKNTLEKTEVFDLSTLSVMYQKPVEEDDGGTAVKDLSWLSWRNKDLNFGGPRVMVESSIHMGDLYTLIVLLFFKICDKKNKVLFTDMTVWCLEDFQLPDESQVVLRIPRKCDLYTFSISELQPEQNVTCLVAKASLDESTRWHRRMAHVNFKTINKLAKEGLVDGLPLKVFTNEHNCVACNKGKQHKASYKHISAVRLITETLQLLHMDLFGPTNIRSIDQKYYSLVVTDDFSRFTWTFYLGTKDETFYVLKEFIALIENQLNKKVKGIRCDNGTEFKNAKLIELCGEKGIKRDYSTACYVLNYLPITNPHNKTPYELISGKVPQIGHLKPFGCQVTILNTSDHLGKFEGKADEGYLVGYAPNSKAYRVYNLTNKRVEETMNLRFLEDKPNVQGIGHFS
ncbi:putative ribonuclease H-like domain-containing protein, partial [Tanacetum coccineum]